MVSRSRFAHRLFQASFVSAAIFSADHSPTSAGVLTDLVGTLNIMGIPVTNSPNRVPTQSVPNVLDQLSAPPPTPIPDSPAAEKAKEEMLASPNDKTPLPAGLDQFGDPVQKPPAPNSGAAPLAPAALPPPGQLQPDNTNCTFAASSCTGFQVGTFPAGQAPSYPTPQPPAPPVVQLTRPTSSGSPGITPPSPTTPTGKSAVPASAPSTYVYTTSSNGSGTLSSSPSSENWLLAFMNNREKKSR